MEKLSGPKQDLLIAAPTLPAVIAFLYGCYKFFDFGIAVEYYLYTYVPTLGAIVSSICIFLYADLAFRRIFGRSTRGLPQALIAFGGFVPYAFSLYLMGFLGVYSLWGLLSNFTIGTLVFGIVWIALGYRMLYTFWIITEISVSE